MSSDPKREPREETSSEVKRAKRLVNDSRTLTGFWDERWNSQYRDILDELPEYGRHGVIAEFLSRLIGRGTVLDIGCGTGILAELIDRNYIDYTGIDISEVPLETARNNKNRQWAKFIQLPVEKYNPKSRFDAIVFNEVIYYLELDSTLSRIKDWLRERHVLVVSTFDFPEGRETKKEISSRLETIAEVSVQNRMEDLQWDISVVRFPT